jgi:hypothetical protein
MCSTHRVNARAIYSNVVQLQSPPPVGDLWSTLTIEFSGGLAGGLVGPTFYGTVPFNFYADTDAIELQVNAPVPEPTSLLIFAGLGLLASCSRYRRRKPASA